MTEIPLCLQDDKFGFCIAKPRDKIPMQKQWQQKPLRYDAPLLQRWLSRGFNYGVIGGYGNLLIIDCDDTNFGNKMFSALPQTFTIRSGKGNPHFYVFCDKTQGFTIHNTEGLHIADVRGFGGQVIGAGSTHPNKNKYEIWKDLPIATLDFENLKRIITESGGVLTAFRAEKKQGDTPMTAKPLSKAELLQDKQIQYFLNNPIKKGGFHDTVSRDIGLRCARAQLSNEETIHLARQIAKANPQSNAWEVEKQILGWTGWWRGRMVLK